LVPIFSFTTVELPASFSCCYGSDQLPPGFDSAGCRIRSSLVGTSAVSVGILTVFFFTRAGQLTCKIATHYLTWGRGSSGSTTPPPANGGGDHLRQPQPFGGV
jgi:hypothetical protein